MALEVTTSSAVFGRIVAALRADRGVSQRRFRRETGLPTGAIERLELGQGNASVDQLRSVARWWDCPPGRLLALLEACEATVTGAGIELVNRRPTLSGARLDRLIGATIEAWIESWHASS